jgi:hypothetical protein
MDLTQLSNLGDFIGRAATQSFGSLHRAGRFHSAENLHESGVNSILGSKP